MIPLIDKILDQQTLLLILEILTVVLYLTGRITKGQFIAEQKKRKGIIKTRDAKKEAVNAVTKPVTVIFDVMDEIPVVNTKLPVINMSVPILAKSIIQAPIGIISDILHNAPIFGSNIKK